MEIVFLHTAPALVPVFDRLISEAASQYTLRHILRDDLLKRSVEAERATPEILQEAADVMVEAASTRPAAVICTCSTIGESVDLAQAEATCAIFRIDQPMASEAVSRGRRIHVMATLATTIGPTTRLLEREAAAASKQVGLTSEVVPEAGSLLLAGRKDEYIACVSRAIESAAANCDVIVLAQASMAQAAAHAKTGAVPVLSSTEIGIKSLLKQLAA